MRDAEGIQKHEAAGGDKVCRYGFADRHKTLDCPICYAQPPQRYGSGVPVLRPDDLRAIRQIVREEICGAMADRGFR